jgi:Zn-finger nucleic acid-binding protein
VCTSCEGVWLDAGELELLENVQGPTPAPTTGTAANWEIAAPTDAGVDPWHAPGAARALPPLSKLPGSRYSSLCCEHCGVHLQVREAHVLNGDVYCASCRPQGAVSGASLPKDVAPRDPDEWKSKDWGDLLSRIFVGF